jgi:ribulose-phosphate 3-epimerase
MLVNPGWGGPKYAELALQKIRTLKAFCLERGLDPIIEVDGGVSVSTAQQYIDAGANCIVAGGSVFSADDKKAAIDALRGVQ